MELSRDFFRRNEFEQRKTQTDIDALKIQRLIDGAREDLASGNTESVFLALNMIENAARRIQWANLQAGLLANMTPAERGVVAFMDDYASAIRRMGEAAQ